MTTDTPKLTLCEDVTFRIWKNGILASNPRAHTHAWLDKPTFNLLSGENSSGPYSVANQTRFSNVDGLLADPTGLQEDLSPLQIFKTADEVIQHLKTLFILIDSEEAYRKYFAIKTSILDRSHFGSFHQQLGAELRIKHRLDPQTWWYAQKFDPETGALRNNLYRFIQESFLERFFNSLSLEGKTVLDFGCGSGMASSRFISRGAKVIGVDPDVNLLSIAAKRHPDSFTPVELKLGESDPFSIIPETLVDFVWLADVWLFYFYSQSGEKPKISAEHALQRLTKHLKKDGRCIIMQPHGVFWLAPWLGRDEQPYTVLTEYANRIYSVVPSLEQISSAVEKAGLTIGRIHEPKASEEGRLIDPKAVAFAQEFPLWWVFDCLKK